MIAHHLTSADLDQIQETFLSLDTDRTGTITRENFRAALRGHLDLAEEEIAQLFEKVDVAHDNEIHYSEFVAAVMPFRIGIQRRQVREAFALFDVSRTGFITLNDLRDVFGGNNFGQVSIDTIIAECEGCDSKTGISFEQFSMHLRKDGTAGPAHDFAKGAPSCFSADSTRASANSLAI
jgi:Ca2+-binding EF-hand superfamily protein